MNSFEFDPLLTNFLIVYILQKHVPDSLEFDKFFDRQLIFNMIDFSKTNWKIFPKKMLKKDAFFMHLGHWSQRRQLSRSVTGRAVASSAERRWFSLVVAVARERQEKRKACGFLQEAWVGKNLIIYLSEYSNGSVLVEWTSSLCWGGGGPKLSEVFTAAC